MDANERNKENNFRKLQEKQMRQAKRHRIAAQSEIQRLQQFSRRDYESGSVAAAMARRENCLELIQLHSTAAWRLEISADPSTRPEDQHIFDMATEADQQAIAKRREVHGRAFTPEADGGGRKKTKSRKSRKKHKKTKHRKSRRKHKKTKRKRRR